jgi:hypothetical protein
MSVTVKSGVSSDVQTVGATSKAAYAEVRDAAGNTVTKTQREQVPTTQGAMLVAGKNDDIAVIQRVDRKGNLLMGNYIPELIENYEGATVNAQKWTATVSGFAQAQTTAGGINITNTGSTTSGAHSILQSQRLFSKIARVPLQIKRRLRHSMVANSVLDFGFGVPATSTLIVPNGVAFRLTSSGTVQGVVTANGSEIAIANVLSTVASNGNTVGGNLTMSNSYYTAGYFVYDVIIDDDNAVFTVQDTSTGEIIGRLSLVVPNSTYKAWGATALPAYIRVFNTAVPASSPIVIESDMQALSLDWRLTPDMSQIAGSLGLSAGRQPFTGVQNENHTNSTAPTSATLSNTAAGYTTLGGRFQFAAVAGAVTDFALFGFTVPAGSRFVCEGIHIELYNTVVAVATTPTIFEWAMGFNSSAVSLATANIVRRQVGCQNFQIGAGVGACATPLDVNFVTPEVTESGRLVHVILNIPVGTATATEIFRGTVLIKGRFI